MSPSLDAGKLRGPPSKLAAALCSAAAHGASARGGSIVSSATAWSSMHLTSCEGVLDSVSQREKVSREQRIGKHCCRGGYRRR